VAAVAVLAGWLLAGHGGPAHPAARQATPAPVRSSPAPPRLAQVSPAALAGQPLPAVRVVWQPTGHQQPGTVLSVQPAGQLPAGTSVLVTAALPHPDTTTTAMVTAADQEINPRPGASAGAGQPCRRRTHAPTVRELVAHACRPSGTRRARSRPWADPSAAGWLRCVPFAVRLRRRQLPGQRPASVRRLTIPRAEPAVQERLPRCDAHPGAMPGHCPSAGAADSRAVSGNCPARTPDAGSPGARIVSRPPRRGTGIVAMARPGPGPSGDRAGISSGGAPATSPGASSPACCPATGCACLS
jgi:hypothetical protein